MQYLHMSSLATTILLQILLLLQAFQTQMLQFVPLSNAINVHEPSRTIQNKHVASIWKLEMQLKFCQ